MILLKKKTKIAFIKCTELFNENLNWELNNWQLMGLLKMVMI